MAAAEDRRKIRQALAPYKGGRFEVGGSGGASGMMFFIDAKGKRVYIGGMNGECAERVAEALNAMLRIMERE